MEQGIINFPPFIQGSTFCWEQRDANNVIVKVPVELKLDIDVTDCQFEFIVVSSKASTDPYLKLMTDDNTIEIIDINTIRFASTALNLPCGENYHQLNIVFADGNRKPGIITGLFPIVKSL